MALVDIAWSLVVVVVVVVVMSCRLLPLSLSLLCNYLPLVYPTYRRCLLLFLFCVPVRNDFWGPIISHPLLFFLSPLRALSPFRFVRSPSFFPCVCVCDMTMGGGFFTVPCDSPPPRTNGGSAGACLHARDLPQVVLGVQIR